MGHFHPNQGEKSIRMTYKDKNHKNIGNKNFVRRKALARKESYALEIQKMKVEN